MSDKMDFREIEEAEDRKTEIIETPEEVNDEEGYERYCFLCHRPESITGKLIDLPNDICVCSDCMQKSFDAMNNMPFDMSKMPGMSGVQFLNLSDLESKWEKKKVLNWDNIYNELILLHYDRIKTYLSSE